VSRHLALAAAALWLAGCGSSAEPDGRLVLRVVDAEGRSVPARVELLDAQGEAHVPPQALPLHFQCSFAPPPAWAEFLVRSDRIENPHTGTEQFYLAGDAALDLPPGRYRLRAFRGPERLQRLLPPDA